MPVATVMQALPLTLASLAPTYLAANATRASSDPAPSCCLLGLAPAQATAASQSGSLGNTEAA